MLSEEEEDDSQPNLTALLIRFAKVKVNVKVKVDFNGLITTIRKSSAWPKGTALNTAE